MSATEAPGAPAADPGATGPPPEGQRGLKQTLHVGDSWTAWLSQRGVYSALLLLLLYNAVATNNFLTVATIQLLFAQLPPVIIVSLGMALVIGTGGVDLSVGATMAIASAVLARFVVTGGNGFGQPIAIAIVAAVLVGLLVGVFNGVVVAVAEVQPIVATLGMLVAGRGIALVITGGALIELFVPFFQTVRQGSLFGIPYIMWVAVLLAGIIAVVVRRTGFGYRVLAIGGNRRASGLAGLPVRRTLITVYAISGTLAAIAGVIATARLRASDPSYIGLLIELSAITAVVVGGTALSGGQVRILGTVAGAIFIQLLETTLVSHNVPDSGARIVEAIIIIAAVYSQRLSGKTR
ncbi:MAG TPA: ABC transporter permease [Lapillicoccus sp.]|jgi:ribose transport system permease protein|uniref:ABC transporter permease n=1 Tax=Lapillicoccus sp. TaxID=1909287 RepID=UPI002F933B8C